MSLDKEQFRKTEMSLFLSLYGYVKYTDIMEDEIKRICELDFGKPVLFINFYEHNILDNLEASGINEQ